jgi:hypothetical protein
MERGYELVVNDPKQYLPNTLRDVYFYYGGVSKLRYIPIPLARHYAATQYQ